MSKSKRRAGKVKTASTFSASTLAKLAPFLIAAIFIGLLTYWPALSAQALYLDDEFYLGSTLIQEPSWNSVSRFFSEVLQPSAVIGYYHPLTLTSVMLDFLDPAISQNPMPFHRTSLLLHLLNTGLVIILLYLLFDNKIVAGIAGLLFGLHPMNADAILWIAERKTVLSTFFALLALIAYVLYTRQPNWKRYALTWGLYVLALLAKPSALPLPLLMLILDWWPLGRFRSQTGALSEGEIFEKVGAPTRRIEPRLPALPGRPGGALPSQTFKYRVSQYQRLLLEKVPFLIVGALSVVVTIISQQRTVGAPIPEENPLLRIALIPVYTPVFYLFKILWPTNLAADYPYPTPFTLANPIVLAGLAGAIMLIVALVISLRRTPAWLAGWLFFFIAIFPALGIISFTTVIAANRFVYLPIIGLLLPLTWAGSALWNAAAPRLSLSQTRNLLLAAGAVLALLEIGVTSSYETHWQNTEGLFRYFLSETPDEWKLHNSLGKELLEQERIDEAIAEYREAVRLAPDRPITRLNLGRVLFKKKDYAAAQQEFTYIVQQDPTAWPAHVLLGMILLESGDPEGAIQKFKEADRIHPGEAEIHYNLGEAFAKQGKLTEATQEYRETLRLDPGYWEAQEALDALAKQP